jgi:uncharacterized protein with HEPN domain
MVLTVASCNIPPCGNFGQYRIILIASVKHQRQSRPLRSVTVRLQLLHGVRHRHRTPRGYFGVDLEAVRITVVNDLPVLKAAIQA